MKKKKNYILQQPYQSEPLRIFDIVKASME